MTRESPRASLRAARVALVPVLVALMALAATPAAAGETPDTTAPAGDRSGPVNPRYVLLDTRGRMVGNEDFPGRFQLITFGYTFCPDVCPTTLATMVQVRHRLGALGERLQLVFITLDPERDTPEVLAKYAEYFGPGITALTGPPQLVQAAADHFRITVRRYADPGAKAGFYSIDHTTGLYLLGPDGQFIVRLPYDAGIEPTAARLDAILRAEEGR
ncbi:MAG: SCO family protein [Steroidobacteraceae bacterium]